MSNPYSNHHGWNRPTMSNRPPTAAASSFGMIGDAELLNKMNHPTDGTLGDPPSGASIAGTSTTATTTVAPIQSNGQQQQESVSSTALQAQLDDLREANFDLQATLATMQAEQAYTLQQTKDYYQQELTKLKGALRLEQQTTQRLLHQHNQHSTTTPVPKRARGNADAMSTSDAMFRKRLPCAPPAQQDDDNAVVMNDFDLPSSSPGAAAAAALGPPPEILLQRPSRHSHGTATTAQTTPSLPLGASPTGDWVDDNGGGGIVDDNDHPMATLPPKNNHSSILGAAWLAQQLLHQSPPITAAVRNTAPTASDNAPTTTTTTTTLLDVSKFLLPIAIQSLGDDQAAAAAAAGRCWTELELVEYLLQLPTITNASTAWHYWNHALLLSKTGRRGIIQAMAQLEQQQQQQQQQHQQKQQGCAAVGSTSSLSSKQWRYAIPTPPPSTTLLSSSRITTKPRIHRLNPDGSKGHAIVYSHSSWQRRQLWYRPGRRRRFNDHPPGPEVAMNVDVVQDWVGNRLEPENPRHLQLLALLLEECPAHSTTIWWEILLPGLALQFIPLHAKYTTYGDMQSEHGPTKISRGGVSRANSGSSRRLEKQRRSSHGSITSKLGRTGSSWNDVAFGGGANPGSSLSRRRLRFQSPVILTSRSVQQQDDDRAIAAAGGGGGGGGTRSKEDEELLTACIVLLDRLIAATRLDILEDWYGFGRNSEHKNDERMPPPPPTLPKQPFQMESLQDAADESALLWIGLLLDIVEGLDYFFPNKSATTKEDAENNSSKTHLPLELPSWYMPMISLFMTMGRTTWGMTALRTRLPDSAGGEVRPNVLDTGIMQLFYLSLMDRHDAIDTLDWAHEQRLFVMNSWVRLWQQVLLFVQGQHSDMEEEALPLTAVVTFRSLVLDLKEYYTSACTRILADAFVDSEIESMIRQQLEELSFDEEEHDDWKGTD